MARIIGLEKQYPNDQEFGRAVRKALREEELELTQPINELYDIVMNEIADGAVRITANQQTISMMREAFSKTSINEFASFDHRRGSVNFHADNFVPNGMITFHTLARPYKTIQI